MPIKKRIQDLPLATSVNLSDYFEIQQGSTSKKITFQTIADSSAADTSLNELSDVVLTSPVTNDLLIFNGTNWINGSTTLNNLSDVIISTPVATEVLYYNGANWINTSAPLLGTDLLGGVWLYSNSLSGAVASGHVGFDNLDLSIATEIRISELTDGGVDVSKLIFDFMDTTKTFYLQDQDDSTKWVRFKFESAFTDNGTWRNATISVLASSANPVNFSNNHHLILYFFDGIISGGGGGAWIAADNGGTPTVLPSATGTDAIAIGDGAVANDTNALVVGNSAYATDPNCIAIGLSAVADDTSGFGGAIALGYNAGGHGNNAIGIGDSSDSASDYSISIGASSIAGIASTDLSAVAIGPFAKARADRAIAIGSNANGSVTAGDYSICIGADDSDTNNARASGLTSIAIGSSGGSTYNGARASGAGSVAIGGAHVADMANGPVAAGTYSICVGLGSAADVEGTVAIGAWSWASGLWSTALNAANVSGSGALGIGATASTGLESIAIGNQSISGGDFGISLGGRANLDATSDYAIAIGGYAANGVVAGAYSITIGADDSATNNAQATGIASIAIGSSTGGDGNGARATGNYSVAIGGAEGVEDGAVASADYATVIGSGADAPGFASTVIGTYATGSAPEAVALGDSAVANAASAIAIGSYANGAVTAGLYSICIGGDDGQSDNAQATGAGAIAIGSSSGSTGDGARASGASSVAIGGSFGGIYNGALSSGSESTAIGTGAIASAEGALTLGAYSECSGFYAVSINAYATADLTVAISGTASAIGSTAIGTASYSAGENAISIGRYAVTDATGDYAICIGSDDSATDNAQATALGAIAIGSSGGGVGNGARASSINSIAIGSAETTLNGAVASSAGSISLGTGAIVDPGCDYSIAIGYNSYTQDGTDSIAIGQSSNTQDDFSIAIGSTAVSGASSQYATALGYSSSAEGAYTTAIGANSKTDRYGETNLYSGHINSRTSIFRYTGTTANNTPTELFILGGVSTRLTIPADCTTVFSILVAARRTDADNESAGYKIEGVIDNNAGTTAFVGTPTVTPLSEDSAAWDVSVSADNTNDALAITVTGENAKTIRWTAIATIAESRG